MRWKILLCNQSRWIPTDSTKTTHPMDHSFSCTTHQVTSPCAASCQGRERSMIQPHSYIVTFFFPPFAFPFSFFCRKSSSKIRSEFIKKVTNSVKFLTKFRERALCIYCELSIKSGLQIVQQYPAPPDNHDARQYHQLLDPTLWQQLSGVTPHLLVCSLERSVGWHAGYTHASFTGEHSKQGQGQAAGRYSSGPKGDWKHSEEEARDQGRRRCLAAKTEVESKHRRG